MVAARGPATTRTVKVPRIQYRNFEVEVEPRADGGEGELRLYPLSFSSEAPVRRFSWDTWEDYDEVLSHAPGDIDFSRAKNGLPLIKSHQRLLHFGSVNEVTLDEKKKSLRGMAAFSSIPLGQEQETMLREGHIKTVSVGYQVLSMDLARGERAGSVLGPGRTRRAVESSHRRGLVRVTKPRGVRIL
jgi:hypothetical protein